MAEERARQQRPWIKREYLEKLPKADARLYTILKMETYEVRLRFATAFCLLLFLNQVVSHAIYNGRAWDKMTIDVLPGGEVLLNLRANKNQSRNNMDVVFKAPG